MPNARLDLAPAFREGYRALLGLERAVAAGDLEPALLDLVRLRASQMNGCAHCIDMHWKDARAAGESEQRLYGLDAWRESPYYSEQERAALEWCEALTFVAEGHVPDSVYEAVRPHFSDEELAQLTFAIIAINGWNRLAIAGRAEVGTYAPRARGRDASPDAASP
jgi:AhpD family alkylhydroperoxidase